MHDLTNIVTSTVSLTFSLSASSSASNDVDMGSEAYLDSLNASIVDVLFVGLEVPS